MRKPQMVESVSNLHPNQFNSPSQDTGLVSKDGYEIISSLKLYIPRNIDIDRLLEENPPNFNYHRDSFVYILSLITSIYTSNRDKIELNNGYTPINKKLLQRRIHEYRKYIEYLKHYGIIEENRQYIPSKTSMGLKLSSFYTSASPNRCSLVPIVITKWTLIKSILYLNTKDNIQLTDDLDYLRKWFDDKLEVDFESGVAYLNELSRQETNEGKTENLALRYNSRLLPFLKLKNNDNSFYVDSTGFRLHTNLTQMMGKLRKFIKYDGKRLCAIDIVNSQPYLSIALLDNEIFSRNNICNKIINPSLIELPNYPIMLVEKIKIVKDAPDVLLFKETVSSGRFYESFGELLVENNLVENVHENELRNLAKEITFSSIYSPNTSIAYNKPMQLFKRLFPNVFKIFKLIKKGNGNHPAFAICLQRLEAELVLHKVCKRISEEKPEIPIFTLHDSVITTEENVEYVKEIMHNILKDNIGIAPMLKVERWE